MPSFQEAVAEKPQILAMKTGLFNGIFGGGPCQPEGGIPHGELYNERKEQEDYVALTKQFYEGVIASQASINQKFFDLYKMNVDNSFGLCNHIGTLDNPTLDNNSHTSCSFI